jgi:surfactin synthase thioesterase subunit
MTIRFLVGGNEDYVKSGFFNQTMKTIRQRQTDLEFQVIPDADHFFILSQQEEAMKSLHRWIDLSTNPSKNPSK